MHYFDDTFPQEEYNAENIAWHAAKKYVTSSLKCPSTAKFSGRIVTDEGNGLFEIYGNVDSQNLFGATVRNRFKILIKNIDSSWVLVDIDFY